MKADSGYQLAGKRVYVCGAAGMVGSAIVRRLASESCEILTTTRAELDLTRQSDVENWFSENRPDAVFLAAARVGGILANETAPADFLYENLMIQLNVVEAAHRFQAEKLLFLGSSCIYPKMARQPIPESELMQGPLEPTNEGYALAKIAGIRHCSFLRRQYGCDFISAMPTNLFGPGDNYDLQSSHVLPAILRKVEEARTEGRDHVTIWGTGSPLREFLHADDCADALVFLMKNYSGSEHLNVGAGEEISILKLAEMIAELCGFDGRIERDLSKPDGTPRKLLDSSRLREMGWSPAIGLREGVRRTIDEYRLGNS